MRTIGAGVTGCMAVYISGIALGGITLWQGFVSSGLTCLMMFLGLFLQEAAENPDNPENKKRSWYSNPGASSFGGDEGAAAAGGGGGVVGKYLQLSAAKPVNNGAGEKQTGAEKRPAAAAGAAHAAVSKKPKADLAAFDAW